MKKVLVLALLAGAVIFMAGPSFAAESGVTIDGSLVFATEPMGGYDSTVGIGIGALVDVTGKMKTSSKDMKIGIRGDINYFNWTGDSYGVDISYKRLVFFGGPRITFHPGGKSNVAPYVEGGLELAYGDAEVYMPGFGTSSATDLNLGLAGGGGIDFEIAKNMKLGVGARLHLISDSFLTLAATFGVAF